MSTASTNLVLRLMCFLPIVSSLSWPAMRVGLLLELPALVVEEEVVVAEEEVAVAVAEAEAPVPVP